MSNLRKTKARRGSDSVDVKPKRIKLSNENNPEVKNNKRDNNSAIRNDAALEDIADQLLSLERNLAVELGKITFHLPVEYIYSPLEYAFNIHTMYVQKYCSTVKKILFLGMNPGPWGMSQTGVPFGEINMVRDWLKICGPVGKPAKEQPNRKGAEINLVHSACDKALAETIKILKAEIIIGIGGYAEKRAQLVVQKYKLPVKVLCLPHPSPRAANNTNWNEKATKKLSEFGLLECFTD
ncbi:Single-strand selective monofunctional uracil DNA glycosylase [Habropoda laboriosa]|uniref:Single-strand selective monofunctional uracil DNA glycosylase n=1 Tax=Habropoda laboriosa TaxID=597456 RepID=A0A0L7QM74_9HYME|nr:Single-strand selective monofunctional uracil DNA glycosylase [Habropoda laboriosa]